MERINILNMDPLSNSVILIDGLSIDVILKDKYLTSHLTFMLALVKKVVGYNFN